MRSKNLVPVQVILPQNQKSMGSNHSAQKGAFEEALQSTIEASLRSSGTVPSHVFSSLYHRCRPLSNESRPGPSNTLLPPPDNSEDMLDVKPDISGINRDLMTQKQLTPSNSDEQKSSPEVPLPTTLGGVSSVSSRDQQSRGPPPLLLTMSSSLMRTNASLPNTDTPTQTANGNRFLMQRLPTMLPKNIPLEQLKQVQTEHLKHIQQIQRWNLLQQQRMATGSLPIPRLPFFNPLMQSPLNRNVLVNQGSAINGAHPHHTETKLTVEQSSPSSPMFRKGFCKGGKDIRLSFLKKDGSGMVSHPPDYTLVAMSISPSTPQAPTTAAAYQPPDIPSEAMVVVAISIRCLPPNQHDISKPILAQCIGCGETSLQTFSLLSSHINLRTNSPSQAAANLVGANSLQRHARNYVLKDSKMPHGCIRGAVIPWMSGTVLPSLPHLMSMYMSATQQAGIRGNGPSAPRAHGPGNLHPRANSQFLVRGQKQAWKHGDKNTVLPSLPPPLRPPLHTSLTSGGIPHMQKEVVNNAQPTTSEQSLILIGSPISDSGSPKQNKTTVDWSPISADQSSHSSTSESVAQSRLDPDWSSTVKFPENLPPHVGRPLVVICWEWQQLRSNIQNVHITHTLNRCYEEAFADTHDASMQPLSREMCYMVTVQYLASLENNEFPTISSLSSWLGRSRIMFSSSRQVQLTAAHAVTLARMAITNQPHKVSLVVSQISQAHAINECIAGLKSNGPSYHVIAHISGDTILDLCILLTGHVSRLAREHLLTHEEYLDFTEENMGSVDFSKIRKILQSVTSSAAERRLTSTSLDEDSSTASSSADLKSISPDLDLNNNLENNLEYEQKALCGPVSEDLFNHITKLSTDHTKIDLTRFTSVRFSFLIPSFPVCQSEAIRDIKESGIMKELGLSSGSNPSWTELKKIFFSTTLNKQRFIALCEHIKVNSSVLFILFHMEAHLVNDGNEMASDWLTAQKNKLLSSCSNVLLVSSTSIPQALLNQNTSISTDNVLFSFPIKQQTVHSSFANHCFPPSSQEFCRSMTYDPEFETESISMLNSLPQYHSAAVNAKLLTQQYIGALTSVVLMQKTISTGGCNTSHPDASHNLTTPTTFTVAKDLLSSGITVLIRVSSEPVAAEIVSEFREARKKLKLQKKFEIMLYASQMGVELSGYFLKLLQKRKGKSDDWKPKILFDLDCIPMVLIYAGKDPINHLMPRSLKYVDLRLAASNLDTQSQTFFLSEAMLGRGACGPGAMKAIGRGDDKIRASEPTAKKRKSDSEEESANQQAAKESPKLRDNKRLKWMSLDEKQALESLRKLSNGSTEEIKEFSSDDENDSIVQEKPDRKRVREPDQNEEAFQPYTNSSVHFPKLIMSKNMYSFLENYANASGKFCDLPPRVQTEWLSHARPIINSGLLSDKQMLDYWRQWTRPLPGHPDYCGEGEEPVQENPRHILLVTPPQSRVPLSCSLFTIKMHRMLLKMMQVEVYDDKSAGSVKACYPIPDSDLLPKWPEHSAIMDMSFDANIGHSSSESTRSPVSNGNQDNAILEPKQEIPIEVSTSPCLAGRTCALDFSHRRCNLCRKVAQPDVKSLYTLSVPRFGLNQHTVCDGSITLEVSFLIPRSLRHHFVFRNRDILETLLAINLAPMNGDGIKTPVFSLGVSGPKLGLYNLDHTLFCSDDTTVTTSESGLEMGSLEIAEPVEKPPVPMHAIVVRHCDVDDFKLAWPNSILMILPKNFDDLGTGAMKYAVQCVIQHSIRVKQEQHSAFSESCDQGDIWPFALLLDDRSVVWTACDTDGREPTSSFIHDNREAADKKTWKNISLLEVLNRMESVPSAHRFAAIGVRPWASSMEPPKVSEDFVGNELSSQFSKCHVTTCVAINVTHASDVLYDFRRFGNEDIDWCMRLASVDHPMFRFNDIAVATKVISSPSRQHLTSIDFEKFDSLVSLADSDFTPVPRHPNLLLELYLGKMGPEVFPKSKGNATHPVLVVDHYFSLGSEVHVEFASSKPGAMEWAVNTVKRYCGLLLCCPDPNLSQGFLQQFQFTPGATVCVVERDRSALRHVVVNLHLENDWHFRLTDEYQTTNDTGHRKALYYLTGVARSSNR